ncbi:hypothetical protein DFJ73DRAFT_630783 [Zopfochytrium polystomum]|nr:hypothetical protein DFJ73DRAFT_630783 [Zopfochytrium polystomum]
MWRLILKSGKAARYFSHVDSMVDFLDERTPVKAISKDQWMSFLDFSLAVTEDLSSYDENSACEAT